MGAKYLNNVTSHDTVTMYTDANESKRGDTLDEFAKQRGQCERLTTRASPLLLFS